MTVHQNLIAGEWVGSEASKNFSLSDTNDIVQMYAQASAEDARQAIAAAKASFPAWSRSGILERHSVLKKTADEIFARREELGTLLAREEGKILPEAIRISPRLPLCTDDRAGGYKLRDVHFDRGHKDGFGLCKVSVR